MAENDLTYINEKFRELLQRIDAMNNTLSNLDLLRIQLVYSTGDIPDTPTSANEYEWPLTPFVANCWSKLSIYHAVYFDLPDNSCIVWQRSGAEPVIRIHSGDYLIKMPDNNSIYIPGNDSYVYIPTTYNASSGQLLFDLINQTTATTQAAIAVPTWSIGSGTGKVATWSGSVTNNFTLGMIDASTYSTQVSSAIKAGHYFFKGEPVILPSSYFSIVISANNVEVTLRSADSSDSVPVNITAAYVPYNFG